MTHFADIHFREATAEDVPAMAQSRLTDPDNGAADTRMAAYLNGQHHPGEALPARVGYLALHDHKVIGYIAGHRTTRHGCSGELQYLFVAPAYRRRGIATALVQRLAEWFQTQGANKVCIALAADSPAEAQPFFENLGALPLKRYWYAWEDIGVSLRR